MVFTDELTTRAAVAAASYLARGLTSRIVLLAARIVPWPLPLDAPPVASEFTEKALSRLAESTGIDVEVRIYVCRDPESTIRGVLEPGSVVVIGVRPRWWQFRAPPLARALMRDGHDVIVAANGQRGLMAHARAMRGRESLKVA